MKASEACATMAKTMVYTLLASVAAGEIMPIDFTPDLGDESTAIYRSGFLVGKTHMDFGKLDISLKVYNHSLRDIFVPVINEPLVIDAFVFRADYDDSCAGFDPPQCLNADILPKHHIGYPPQDSYHAGISCCTQDLVAAGDCLSPNTVIFNETLYDGYHVQFNISVGESSIPREQLEATKLALSDGGGRYIVALLSCSVDSAPVGNATFGDVYLSMAGYLRFHSFWGYLQLSLVGIWILFAGLCMAYMTLLLWYGFQLWKQQRGEEHAFGTLRKSEKWICIAILLGLVEAVAQFSMFEFLNTVGRVSMSAVWIHSILNGVKICVSFCLGIYLAQAAGYAWHADEVGIQNERRAKSRAPLTVSVVLYAVLRMTQGVTTYVSMRPDLMRAATLHQFMAIRRIRLVSQQLSALVSVLMVLWMLIAVSRTIRYFASLQIDRSNRIRYLRLRLIFVVTTVASFCVFFCTSMSLPFLVAYSLSYMFQPWMFYVSAMNDIIYFVTLCGVCYLWQPSANREEDTYLSASLLNAHPIADAEEIDILEFSYSQAQAHLVTSSPPSPPSAEETFQDEQAEHEEGA